MKIFALLGRIFFALIFVLSGFHHLTGDGVAYAAAAGVPSPAFLVPFAGLLSLVGGLSVLLGYKTKWGAWLLVIFLVPVSYYLHPFWTEKDPGAAQMQMAMFMKNVSMLGGALLLTYFGAGPYSIDNKGK
ncbi:DoxX family protein [Chitinophaga nivalis]|uniref:DoxX family protein n=1 Tax=Chitinophaga nivalis TaxID=2991709 RepID=A0ABT3IP55_9BACT|nr:DoxX family protein [Chitinophaga nivalis]MCW3464633.1 DoxX family protein [Chitinophaga nivalis]MCW3485676.1 DoxX family protein [Chitinophaga nivalis]